MPCLLEVMNIRRRVVITHRQSHDVLGFAWLLYVGLGKHVMTCTMYHTEYFPALKSSMHPAHPFPPRPVAIPFCRSFVTLGKTPMGEVCGFRVRAPGKSLCPLPSSSPEALSGGPRAGSLQGSSTF